MPSIPELEVIRRAQILEAALAAISTKGYANVTMDDICAASKLSKGGLAHYFKSKNELFMAAFEEFFKRIFERSQKIMESYADPIDKVLSFDWLYDANDPDAFLGYPILFDCISIAIHQPEYGKLYHDWVGNWVVLLKAALNEAVKMGLLKSIKTEPMARTISAIYNGLATRWFVDRESHSSQWAIDSFQKAINGLLSPYLIFKPEIKE
ncbi:TetR/AcrR family transcriptional regulator [bacterium]|nr:TetR/AcrR family transcriptional regulator [bacterium]